MLPPYRGYISAESLQLQVHYFARSPSLCYLEAHRHWFLYTAKTMVPLFERIENNLQNGISVREFDNISGTMRLAPIVRG